MLQNKKLRGILENKWFLTYIHLTSRFINNYAILQKTSLNLYNNFNSIYFLNFFSYFLFDRLFLMSKYGIILNDKVVSTLYSKNFNYASFFCNWEYFDISIYKNTLKLYNFYSILLKKQNSFLKKKTNLLNNFYTLTQKSRNYEDNIQFSSSLSWNFFKYNFFFNYLNKLDISKVLDLRKKIKKTILENRKMLGNFLLNSSKRSFRLNRLVLLLGQKKIWAMCNNLELNIVAVLVNSRLVYTNLDALNFLKSGYIFVNRKVVFNSSYVVRKGDIIELLFSKAYYVYMLRLKLVNDKVFVKMRNKLWTKIKNKTNLTAGNERFLINVYKNNGIYKYYIPSYLEVDYSVLTIIVIMNLKTFLDFSFFFRKFLSYFFFRHYVWKWLS